MKTTRLRQVLITLLATTAPAAFAGNFENTDAGPYDYTDATNWTGDVINNVWGSTLTANQTITFSQDYTTVDPDGAGSANATINITNNSTFNHTFIGGGANRTLTLGGNISLASNVTNANTVTFGSTNDGQRLNIDLGGASRTLGAGTNRTLELLNVLSGTGGITQQGAGTLRLSNTANSYTSGTNIGASGQAAGVLEVTKLANGGQDSSIGKSDNGTNRIIFGGTTPGGGTLRYIGSGDSTDRRFAIGGQGAVFDASGTGALIWTNTGSADVSPSAGQARTITFKGTSTHNNTMSVSFGDSGLGKTSVTKTGSGTWIFAGANTASGDITVTEGTLGISANDRLGNSARLVMNGGTFSTGGFAETLGTLQLTANSIIDLGNNATGSALAFANSASELWSASISLSIVNFTDGTDSVFFGTGGLTGDQLAQIRINGTHYALLDGSGYLILGAAIPEPSTFALLGGLGALLLAAARRQRRAA